METRHARDGVSSSLIGLVWRMGERWCGRYIESICPTFEREFRLGHRRGADLLQSLLQQAYLLSTLEWSPLNWLYEWYMGTHFSTLSLIICR